jgi:hypothetical protein
MLVELSLLLSAQVVGGGFDSKQPMFGSEVGQQLGQSVADAGDVNMDGVGDFIVGAPGTTVGSSIGAGMATILSGADGSTLQVINGLSAYSSFGFSLAGAGDVNADGYADVIIGAPFENAGPLGNAGAAYVISGSTGAVLHHFHGAAAADYCGWAVTGVGDLNSDGFDDVAVGHPLTDQGGSLNVGTVFVHSGFNGSVLYQIDGVAGDDLMGSHLSSAGDTDGDGVPDILVGSPNYNNDFGRVWLISGASGFLRFVYTGQVDSGGFGRGIAGLGDVNLDGFDDFAISDYRSDWSGVRTGSVSIHSGVNGLPLHRIDGPQKNASFGYSIDVVGDFDQDGISDILIGAPGLTLPGRIDPGAAGIYSTVTGARIYEFAGTQWNTAFGSAVAGIDDIDGDGYSEVLVGGPYYDLSSVNNAGFAEVWGVNPYMTITDDSISASNGGLIGLQLDFPYQARDWDYKILMSATGMGPIHLGVDVPLSMDALVTDTFFGIYPSALTLTGMQGQLDGFSNAVAWIGVPQNTFGSMAGNSIYMAAIANSPGNLPEYSSIGIEVKILP